MTSKPNISEDLYVHLGKLFYAIASSDKEVRPEEHEAFLNMMNTASYFSNQEARTIIETFQELLTSNADSDKNYEDFLTFMKGNRNLFKPELNNIILTCANNIASSFSNKNKSELIILAKLSLQLQKDN